jgi:hypothetical protein
MAVLLTRTGVAAAALVDILEMVEMLDMIILLSPPADLGAAVLVVALCL